MYTMYTPLCLHDISWEMTPVFRQWDGRAKGLVWFHWLITQICANICKICNIYIYIIGYVLHLSPSISIYLSLSISSILSICLPFFFDNGATRHIMWHLLHLRLPGCKLFGSAPAHTATIQYVAIFGRTGGSKSPYFSLMFSMEVKKYGIPSHSWTNPYLLVAYTIIHIYVYTYIYIWSI